MNQDINITLDNGIELDDVVGRLNDISPKARLVRNMFKNGYAILLTPVLDENGELLSVSLQTGQAWKTKVNVKDQKDLKKNV